MHDLHEDPCRHPRGQRNARQLRAYADGEKGELGLAGAND